MGTQICGHCREDKELSEYAPSYRGRSGTWCRACMRSRYTPKPRPPLPDIPEGYGYCYRCKSAKPLDEFYGLKVKNWCKSCYSDWHRARYVPKGDATDEPRECAWCGMVYQPKQRRPSEYCSKKCGQLARNAQQRGQRDIWLRKKYGISEVQFDEMRAKQDNRCAICLTELPGGRGAFHVDHDHDTKRVRGLLCMQCNHGLGNFQDDPGRLRRAAAYIEESGEAAPLMAGSDPGTTQLRRGRDPEIDHQQPSLWTSS